MHKTKQIPVFRTIFIFFLCLVELYPLFWMLTASLKQQSEWTSKPAYALNSGFYFKNYIDAWTRGNMRIFFFNSLLNTFISLFFIIIMTTTISFALVKMYWPLRTIVAKYFTMGIMVPVATALIPLFQIYTRSGLINTRLSLILVYTAFGLSLSIYLMTAYLRTLPDEIMEAAVIDGCGIYKMFWYVVIPLLKNAIITVLVLQFFFKWNDLIFSMTFVSDTKLKTIQTGLLYFTDEFGSKNWGAIFASVSLSVFPLLFLYLFLNKTIMEGMTAGAVKG
jgi:raffinose/stachyose/melibiose transport system permease protein